MRISLSLSLASLSLASLLIWPALGYWACFALIWAGAGALILLIGISPALISEHFRWRAAMKARRASAPLRRFGYPGRPIWAYFPSLSLAGRGYLGSQDERARRAYRARARSLGIAA